MPPATAFPQTFWKRIANVNARATKKTAARAPDDPLPSIEQSMECYHSDTKFRLTVHDDHHQVGRVPVDLAVDKLAGGRRD